MIKFLQSYYRRVIYTQYCNLGVCSIRHGGCIIRGEAVITCGLVVWMTDATDVTSSSTHPIVNREGRGSFCIKELIGKLLLIPPNCAKKLKTSLLLTYGEYTVSNRT